MSTDWEKIRHEFPALENWTFLNTATFGQLPRRATEAMVRHFAHRDDLACADFLSWFDDMDGVRDSVARLIHAQANDIAFVPNASSALSIVMNGIAWNRGDRIVTLVDEFPNNLYHAALLSRHGVELIETEWRSFFDAITPETRLVAISTVNYTSGFRPPLEAISTYLRDRGVLFYLDGTQSVGAIAFDCDRVQPDMLAVHGYKWLLSPNGAGFLYVRPEIRKTVLPNVVGWRSHRSWREVDQLHHGMPELPAAAERYEGGMITFAVLYAMGASVEMMLEIGPAAIERRVMDLAEELRIRLRKMGARLLFDEAPNYDSPIVAAKFDGFDVSLLAQELRNRKVLVAARHGNLRVSPHFYNNEEDVDRFERELRSLV